METSLLVWQQHTTIESLFCYVSFPKYFFVPSHSTEHKHLTHPNNLHANNAAKQITSAQSQLSWYSTTSPKFTFGHVSFVYCAKPKPLCWVLGGLEKKHPSGKFERGPRIWDCVCVWVVVREQIAWQIKGKSVSSPSGSPSKWRRGVLLLHGQRGHSVQCFRGRIWWRKLDSEKRAKKWAKCSKRWSSSGQVPPLVPTAKVKPNLLSAPLKRVS